MGEGVQQARQNGAERGWDRVEPMCPKTHVTWLSANLVRGSSDYAGKPDSVSFATL